jgi:hypothetical protein
MVPCLLGGHGISIRAGYEACPTHIKKRFGAQRALALPSDADGAAAVQPGMCAKVAKRRTSFF